MKGKYGKEGEGNWEKEKGEHEQEGEMKGGGKHEYY